MTKKVKLEKGEFTLKTKKSYAMVEFSNRFDSGLKKLLKKIPPKTSPQQLKRMVKMEFEKAIKMDFMGFITVERKDND